MTVAISPPATAPLRTPGTHTQETQTAGAPTAGASDARSLRVAPAPRSEPLTDDERASTGQDAPPMGALLLPLDLGRGQATVSRTMRGILSGTMDAAIGATVGIGAGSDPAVPALPAVDLQQAVAVDAAPSPARLATRRFLATCVEVIGGFRPLAQLRPLCLPERFAEIADRLGAHPATGPGWRSRGLAHIASRGLLGGRGTVAPPRGGRANQTGPGDRVRVRRVQICEAVDGVAEIAVVLARRDRVWAMALRLERRRGRWLCTHLEVV